MRIGVRFLIVSATAVIAGCGGRAPLLPSGPLPSTPAPTPAPRAAIAVSSFVVSVHPRPGGPFAINGVFTLAETSGEGTATLQSVEFEVGGVVDIQDAGCWGDAPIRIKPNSTFDGQTLGYCAPFVLVNVLSDVAMLAVTYQNEDGSRVTVRASTTIPR